MTQSCSAVPASAGIWAGRPDRLKPGLQNVPGLTRTLWVWQCVKSKQAPCIAARLVIGSGLSSMGVWLDERAGRGIQPNVELTRILASIAQTCAGVE